MPAPIESKLLQSGGRGPGLYNRLRNAKRDGLVHLVRNRKKQDRELLCLQLTGILKEINKGLEHNDNFCA